MNPELREAIRTLLREPVTSPEAKEAVRIVTAYVEHGPMPDEDDPEYIPFKCPPGGEKPKGKRK